MHLWPLSHFFAAMTALRVVGLLTLCVLTSQGFNVSAPLQYLVLQSNAKLSDLVGDPPNGDSHLEGSGVFYRRDVGQAYVVCDNLPTDVVDVNFNGTTDSYINLNRVKDIESYEGITFDNQTKTYYLVTEEVHVVGFNRYKARILAFNENFRLQSRNDVDFTFRDSHKGIEGLASVYRNGSHYLLGLCEGNHCKGGDTGKSPGKGTILVLRFDPTLGSREGRWIVDDKIMLPSELPFEDYSGIDVYENRWITVVSQTSRLFWAGQLNQDSWSVEGGSDAGYLYAFPKNQLGQKEFCNVEGVSWIDSSTVVITSDKSDTLSCQHYAESISIFTVPFNETSSNY